MAKKRTTRKTATKTPESSGNRRKRVRAKPVQSQQSSGIHIVAPDGRTSVVPPAESEELAAVLAAAEQTQHEIEEKEAKLESLRRAAISIFGNQIAPKTETDLREVMSKDAEDYTRHATNLRNWLVAFGIGGIALLSRDDLIFKSADVSLRQSTMFFLMAGVCLQACLAILNKYTSRITSQLSESFGTLNMYLRVGPLPGIDDSMHKEMAKPQTLSQKAADYLDRAVWPNLALDVGTIVLYGIATARLWLSL